MSTRNTIYGEGPWHIWWDCNEPELCISGPCDTGFKEHMPVDEHGLVVNSVTLNLDDPKIRKGLEDALRYWRPQNPNDNERSNKNG